MTPDQVADLPDAAWSAFVRFMQREARELEKASRARGR
jgi:diadenosine tetraphosphate (Ap4A) HIT family hydrolase